MGLLYKNIFYFNSHCLRKRCSLLIWRLVKDQNKKTVWIVIFNKYFCVMTKYLFVKPVFCNYILIRICLYFSVFMTCSWIFWKKGESPMNLLTNCQISVQHTNIACTLLCWKIPRNLSQESKMFKCYWWTCSWFTAHKHFHYCCTQ